MQFNPNAVLEIGIAAAAIFIFLLWSNFKKSRGKYTIKVRDASLTCEELEEHAKKIAIDHTISRKNRLYYWPVSQMNENYDYISSIYRELNDDVSKKYTIPPAAEWLLDNFYIIEEQVKVIRKTLTKREYLRLPALKCGHLKGHARIYAIAMELVAHTDGQINERVLLNYIKAYQSHSVLSDSEIWALPTMILMVLIENIKLLCEKLKDSQREWRTADELIDNLSKNEYQNADKFLKSLENRLKSANDVNPSFIEHLSYRLRRAGRGFSRFFGIIDNFLAKYGTTLDAVTQKEHSTQAAHAVSMGNFIISMKFILSLDWTDVFESSSIVEQILNTDPDGTYPQMDLPTRNFYRKRLEKFASIFKASEIHIAKEAIKLAQEASNVLSNKTSDIRKCHVGYYLIGNGAEDLKKRLNYTSKIPAKIGASLKKHPAVLYLGLIAVVSLIITWFIMHLAYNITKNYKLLLSILSGIAAFIPATEISIGLINWAACNVLKPTFFPKLELRDGIPEKLCTIVVIPALLPDEKRVKELLENLETHYLANKEESLFFALAGDYKDSPSKDTPGDQEITKAGLTGVKELNQKYGKSGRDIFYYFHRHRIYNQKQKKWMGWERKRGALMEFNELLKGSDNTSYSIVSESLSRLPEINYVITLDADTILPIDAAKKMIGTMAHPLNRPVINRQKGIVTEGYGLIQPRINFDIESANRSLFSRIFTGQEGIDPYACAVSDIYQDIFKEGIFTGKGIYDLKVFEEVLHDAIPENSVLSHDLLEGSYVRTGLVTDIELIDSFPSSYSSYSARIHRWIRGDWQLIPWINNTVKDRHGNTVKNPLALISRWKILDNLRRSLVNPSLLLLVLLGFCILPGHSSFWLSFAVLTSIFPFITAVVDYIISLKPFNYKVKRHLPVISGLKANLYQILLQLVFLPYQAYLMGSAILVTLARVMFTKKNLLEWVTAADVEKGQKNSLQSFWNKMNISVIISGIISFLAFMFKPSFFVLSLAVFFIWSSSPFIAYRISKTRKEKPFKLSGKDIRELRIISRKTWRYFEEFVNHKNNYLPPDNYQEDPPNGIAYRTSPTNVGLAFMAFLTARDLGYIGTFEMIERISKTLSTVEKVEKWNGHLYNWYDTRTLRPLKPRYVSTVDSGNLVCYLIALVQGLHEYLKKPLVDIKFAQGIKDTAELAGKESGVTFPCLKYLDSIFGKKPQDFIAWSKILEKLSEICSETTSKKVTWINKFTRMIGLFKNELDIFMPWIDCFKNIRKFSVPELFPAPDTTMHISRTENEQRRIVYKDLSEYYGEKQSIQSVSPDSFDYIALKDRLSGNMKFHNFRDTLRLGEDALEPLNRNIPLKDMPDAYKEVLNKIDAIISDFQDESCEGYLWLKNLRTSVEKSIENSEIFIKRYNEIIDKINKIIEVTSFKPLFDDKKQLFSIGFNIEENRLTNSYYDLLASEARQTSYIAIARGEIPARHWFKLGRTLTVVDFYKGMVSWTGTMFEYLMPLILMKVFKNTLLDETYSFVVRSQKKYGKQKHVPWGVSESGFYAFDIGLNYQYKAIGVPWLGLKRGLIGDTVVAPYASFLALPVDPTDAFENIMRLREEGLDGPYGFYEAIDYTPDRLPFGAKRAIVKSYMVHHQGMSLLSLNNYINGNILQERFHRDPVIKTAQLLLQEKVPSNIVLTKENKEKIVLFKDVVYKGKDTLRRFNAPDPVITKAHILSNGNYSVMITDKGTGYSKNNVIAITRWREDITLDNYGMFFYIRNLHDNTLWSAAFEPYNKKPGKYEVTFTSDKAKFVRIDNNIETVTEIAVASGDNAEIRRITLKNHGNITYELEITSYFEVVIAPQGADVAHPAFSNLFVKTEFIPELNSLVASRRPRSESDKNYWLSNTTVIEGEKIGGIEYETDRAQFIGRGHTVLNPIAMERNKPLSNSSGSVLDPIMSLRVRLRVLPGHSAKISYLVNVGESREAVVEFIEKYLHPESIDGAFKMALTRSQVEGRYLNIKASEIELYQDMISHIIFLSPLRKMYAACFTGNKKGQSSLWPYGISGDLPIVLVSLRKTDEIDIVYDCLKAHEYWRLKGLRIDLVILNEEEGSYSHPLRALLADIVSSSHAHDIVNKSGGVFILNQNNIPPEDTALFHAVSRIILRGNGGSLTKQLNSYPRFYLPEAEHVKRSSAHITDEHGSHPLTQGKFGAEGKEYIIQLDKGQHTPLPWVNIISNPQFGFISSESGSGYTWSENSRENKLTPWSNDPVSDISGEIFYIRDSHTSDLWTITPLPIREDDSYIITHGFGYTSFEHSSHGIIQSLSQFVPTDDPVKISLISLKNSTENKCSLAITYYVRPVMGVNEQVTAMHIITKQDESGALTIVNPYNEEFSGRIAFMDVSENTRSVTGDRKEFFGRGNPNNPTALKNHKLSGTLGAGFDPCAAMQVNISLESGEEKEIVFLLGMVKDVSDIARITGTYKSVETAKASLESIKKSWGSKLGILTVDTPDISMNTMLNGWLLYQVISCRLWSRSAFYQSGGAFGFRDQLQDCLSLIHILPELVRNQILLHASHQFIEGDVQHWWHEPSGKGTRTRISDDLLWLPYVTSEYITATGDYGILDTQVYYLESEDLKDYEDERYDKPHISDKSSALYDHCIRSIEKSLKFGEHGIPLMGSGDWNDGMNTVGNTGKGESVWLGWFLYAVLNRFIPICEKQGDIKLAKKYADISNNVIKSIEENAWDGNWYKRAYFDTGTPLGSLQNSECKIDSISQSWAVISGGGDKKKIKEAMNSLENYLVQRTDGLIKLLTPPFDESDLEPGYIKGYLPGVRENGGQYTHAAAWVIIAFAMLGDGDKAEELFELINPINHTRTQIEISKYKAEPYVMPADVYAVSPHTGRGGWTWYTGSASWYYKAGLEYILGFRKIADRLIIDPCIPKKWERYSIRYKYIDTQYEIEVLNPDRVNKGVKEVVMDGKELKDKAIMLKNDQAVHKVEVCLGK